MMTEDHVAGRAMLDDDPDEDDNQAHVGFGDVVDEDDDEGCGSE